MKTFEPGRKEDMEEADLLKERLQAITDKRRIQEDISKKRRQIEEEKLKLQYIKKKALREQWLMDGLSQQSEEEQEAMRLQAQDEQLQSDQLQSNILRIEKEIAILETQELNISANEEVVLRRLKEVERTAEDIIKDLNAEYRADVTHHIPSAFPDFPLPSPQARVKPQPVREAAGDEEKRATFALEISVEHNKRTGKSQVVSTATVSPESAREKGLKVYDDGHKSVYALPSPRQQASGVGEMTPTEVEELLQQATEETAPAELQLHPPVYAAAYTGGSRPSTPGTPTRRRGGNSQLKEETPPVKERPEQEPPRNIHPNLSGQSEDDVNLTPPPNPINPRGEESAAPVSVTVRTEGAPAPRQPVYRAPPSAGVSTETNGPPVNLAGTLPEEGGAESITMIFMGYENAADVEDEDVQAELVVIGNSDDEDGGEGEEYVSFHPEGYTSRVFQPRVGVAMVTSGRDVSEDVYANWEDFELHKPTFVHKPGPPHLQRGGPESANISLEKMKLCSTVR